MTLLHQPYVRSFLENRIDDAIARHSTIRLTDGNAQFAVSVDMGHSGPFAKELSCYGVEALFPETTECAMAVIEVDPLSVGRPERRQAGSKIDPTPPGQPRAWLKRSDIGSELRIPLLGGYKGELPIRGGKPAQGNQAEGRVMDRLTCTSTLVVVEKNLIGRSGVQIAAAVGSLIHEITVLADR